MHYVIFYFNFIYPNIPVSLYPNTPVSLIITQNDELVALSYNSVNNVDYLHLYIFLCELYTDLVKYYI